MTEPVRRGERLADRVTAQLEALVIGDSLQPGDLLPPERELCELLGVSRTVVREAVRTLVAKGLLEVRQGHGTVVRSPDVRLASEVMTHVLRGSGADRVAFPRIHEVRRLIEVETAGLAAERHTPEDLLEIAKQLHACGDAADPESWALADVAFHASIAAATHNILFPVLLSSMSEILMELRRAAVALPDTTDRAHRHHELIYAAIRDRAPAAARRAMREHMAEAEVTFQKARVARAVANSVRDEAS